MPWFIIAPDHQRKPRERVGLPRKRRGEYPGGIYHVMSRGDRREDIFLNLPACLQAMSIGRTSSKPWPKPASKPNPRSMLIV